MNAREGLFILGDFVVYIQCITQNTNNNQMSKSICKYDIFYLQMVTAHNLNTQMTLVTDKLSDVERTLV